MLFSQHFGINKSQAQLDFVDIDLDQDKHLFIDPYAFSQANDAWSVLCHDSVVSFFQAVLDAIKRNDEVRGRAILDNLGEPSETCLGLSAGGTDGNGVGRVQADQLFDRLKESTAAQTGVLEELSDCELFIPGIGPDKISDITTNIIRRHLIQYTQTQCELHRVPLEDGIASGMLWDSQSEKWVNRYETLPVINGKKVLLVPKASVRWSLTFSHSRFYNDFVLTFLQTEHLQQNTALVETLKNGRRRVTKQSLKERHPLAKDYLAAFSDRNPAVLESYKKLLAVSNGMPNTQIEEDLDEGIFAQALINELPLVDRGNAAASQYHDFMVGVIEFIFYPNLIWPVKEDEINQGRKRIDMSYTNNAKDGFFFRRRLEPRCGAVKVMVECKNYQKEMANPELDQLAGRFSPNRGRLGFLLGRSFDDRKRFIDRCRDTAQADNGFIIALVDADIIQFLEFVRDGQRSKVDRELERRFAELIN